MYVSLCDNSEKDAELYVIMPLPPIHAAVPAAAIEA
jgi:hypothetical protein